VNLKIFSSNAHGRSVGHVQLETTPSKVAELQIGQTVLPSATFFPRFKKRD
jgi:hypothetical protein